MLTNASRSAPITVSAPPGTAPSADSEQCTSSTPPDRTPAALTSAARHFRAAAAGLPERSSAAAAEFFACEAANKAELAAEAAFKPQQQSPSDVVPTSAAATIMSAEGAAWAEGAVMMELAIVPGAEAVCMPVGGLRSKTSRHVQPAAGPARTRAPRRDRAAPAYLAPAVPARLPALEGGGLPRLISIITASTALQLDCMCVAHTCACVPRARGGIAPREIVFYY